MRLKIISSLEKCFLDENVSLKPAFSGVSMLKNERYSFQICYDMDPMDITQRAIRYQVDSPLKEYISVYRVQNIPSVFPCYPDHYDENYLRTTPGLYPDLLQPVTEGDCLPLSTALQALWLEVAPEGKVSAGTYPVTVRIVEMENESNVLGEVTTSVEIIDAELPAQELIFTQWFYPDCLQQYYGTEMYSEEHWKIIENFMRNARKYGQNMILTPLLSPELDTYIGGYRPSTQLVDITLTNGKYSFDFTKLGRWVDLCNEIGIQYFEINHFFSQWGGYACPQVHAVVDGEAKRIFGWDTSSESAEYAQFLGELLPAFLAFMKSKDGADKRCYFHISDEPTLEHMDNYTRCSNLVKPLVEGYPIMDALSNYDFYEKGLVERPVPGVDHIQPFLDNNVQNLWTYYCCMQREEVPNRFFAMPSARNRIIGAQLYKFNIVGFLQWGYNFYNSRRSFHTVNPYICSDADAQFPSGDPYSVYPGEDGTPWPSLRQLVFCEALQDLRALKLCESLYGRQYTMELLEAGTTPITFFSYPKDADYLLNLRRRVNAAIRAKVSK